MGGKRRGGGGRERTAFFCTPTPINSIHSYSKATNYIFSTRSIPCSMPPFSSSFFPPPFLPSLHFHPPRTSPFLS